MLDDEAVTLDEEGELSYESEEALSLYLNRVLSEHDKPDDPVWHYTGAEGCEGIVARDEVWATHYAFTNDTTELIRGEQIVRKIVDELADGGETRPRGKRADGWARHRREAYRWLAYELPEKPLFGRPPLYLACFTEAGGDAMPHWAGYGSRGAGYSLKLDVKPPEFATLDGVEFLFARVVYREKAFAATVRRQLFRHANLYAQYRQGASVLRRVGMFMMRECAALSVRFKDQAFEHEKEWRIVAEPRSQKPNALVHFRTRGNMLVPYLKVPVGRAVRGLVCGPAHAGEAAARLEAAKMLLVKHGYSKVSASLSEVPFRGP